MEHDAYLWMLHGDVGEDNTTPLVMSFMGPSLTVTNFVKKLVEHDVRKGVGGALPIIVDHHYYLNWQLPDGCYAWDGSCQMTWDQVP